jgi:hypothetical protein
MSGETMKTNMKYCDSFVMYAIKAWNEYQTSKIFICPNGAIDEELSNMKLNQTMLVKAIASKMNQPYTSENSLRICVINWVSGVIRPKEHGGRIENHNEIHWKIPKTQFRLIVSEKAEYNKQYYQRVLKVKRNARKMEE